MRIRIALTTAIAVIAGMTTGIFTLSTSHQASAQAAMHHAHHTDVTWLNNTALSGFSTPEPSSVTSSVTSSVIDPQTSKTSGNTAKTSTTTTPPVKATPVVVTTPPAPTPPVPAPVPVTDASSVATTDWTCIRVHESGDQYNNPREPSGAYGILLSTWRSFGYSGWPYEAPVSVQDQLALKLYALYGFRPWSSRFACGL